MSPLAACASLRSKGEPSAVRPNLLALLFHSVICPRHQPYHSSTFVAFYLSSASIRSLDPAIAALVAFYLIPDRDTPWTVHLYLSDMDLNALSQIDPTTIDPSKLPPMAIPLYMQGLEIAYQEIQNARITFAVALTLATWDVSRYFDLSNIRSCAEIDWPWFRSCSCSLPGIWSTRGYGSARSASYPFASSLLGTGRSSASQCRYAMPCCAYRTPTDQDSCAAFLDVLAQREHGRLPQDCSLVERRMSPFPGSTALADLLSRPP